MSSDTSSRETPSDMATERAYSKRELDDKFKNIDILIREKHDDQMIKIGDLKVSLNQVVEQTTKTNGRVNKQEQWRYTMVGAIGVLTLIIVPIMGWGLYTLVNIQSTITDSVNAALSSYNVNK